MKRLLGLAVLAGALLLTFTTLQSAKPGWWERLWYPLSTTGRSFAVTRATTTSILRCSLP